jgi:hypothetical protein
VSMSMLVLVLKLMVSESMSMSIGDAESTAIADDEPSNLVGVVRLAMVGEGAGESVDPHPVVPTVAPIDEVHPRQCPCSRAFET